jgi:hypothetical protein
MHSELAVGPRSNQAILAYELNFVLFSAEKLGALGRTGLYVYRQDTVKYGTLLFTYIHTLFISPYT